MAGKDVAGCGGWIVAGLLLIRLISQCGKDPALDASVGSQASGPTSWLYVQPATANCRSGPSTGDPSRERLVRNTYVGMLASENGWTQIDRSPDCWIRSDLLGEHSAREPAPARGLISTDGDDYERRATRRSRGSAYYANCSAARAAGAAPVMRGEPGYARRLDRDGDGVGCE